MNDEPFLLDRGYRGTLDSGAFRERFLKLNPPPPREAWWLYPVALLCWFVPVSFLMAYCAESGDPGASFIVFWTVVIAVSVSAVCFLGYFFIGPDRKSPVRLAFVGQVVTGRMVECRRTKYWGEGEEGQYDVVEVTYEAETPQGVAIRGTKGLPRDDLMNAPLPTAGTPVAVLVLNKKYHGLL